MSAVEVLLVSSASPLRARSLLTVRAAISSASSSERPRSSSPSLMWSYCRSRFLLHACWGIRATSSICSMCSICSIGSTRSYPPSCLACLGVPRVRTST